MQRHPRRRSSRRVNDARFPLAIAAAAGTLWLASPAAAGTHSDTVGDILTTYTGPTDNALDVTSVTAFQDATNVTLIATLNGDIDPASGDVYVWGVNRGVGLPLLDTGPAPQVGKGVDFDAVAVLQPGAMSFIALILPTSSTTPLAAGAVTFTGNTLKAVIPLSMLPSNGADPSHYLYNLWPRKGLGNNAQIADFAPDTSGIFASVPEPATWALALTGFGMMGGLLRRRRAAAASA